MTYVNQASCVTIGVLFPVLGFCTCLLRFWVRSQKNAAIGPDDWFAVVGVVFTAACGALFASAAVRGGFGHHSVPSEIKPGGSKAEVWQFMRELEFFFYITRELAIGTIKLSVLFFYRRIFRGKTFTIVNWTAITLVALWTIGFTISDIFLCRTHVDLNWASPGPATTRANAECGNGKTQAIANAVTDVALDLFIITIPIPIIWRLNMDIKKKISISAVFLVGLWAVAAAMVRLVVFIEFEAIRAKLDPKVPIFGVQATDAIGTISMGFFWLMIEIGVAMVVCCLPSLAPLIERPELITSAVRSLLSKTSLISKHSQNDISLLERRGKYHPSGAYVKSSMDHENVVVYTHTLPSTSRSIV